MNEGRMFLYASPNVLFPAMFAILVLTSLAVHFSILNNTTWFSAFWEGGAAETSVAAPAVEAPAPAVAAPAPAEAAPAEAVPAE